MSRRRNSGRMTPLAEGLRVPGISGLLLAMISLAGCRWHPDREEHSRLTIPTTATLSAEDRKLWQEADAEEAQLLEQADLHQDPQLDAYMKNVVSRLLPPNLRAASASIRVHVVEDPELTASAAPNGAILISTGMLTALRNEAQLASVLGHELAHFLGRHAWKQRMADQETGSTVSRMRVSRLLEREADEVASWLVQDAGYDLFEFERAYEIMSREGEPPAVDRAWLSHPAPPVRMNIIRRIVEGRSGGEVDAERYDDAVVEVLLVSAEIALDRFEVDAAKESLDRHLARRPNSPRGQFLLGRVLQQQDPDGEASAAAIAAFERAREGIPDDPDLLRAIGLAYRKVGRRQDAQQALDRYLALAPEARDAAILRAYVESLGGS
jgi:predicted Zn-dependent protease